MPTTTHVTRHTARTTPNRNHRLPSHPLSTTHDRSTHPTIAHRASSPIAERPTQRHAAHERHLRSHEQDEAGFLPDFIANFFYDKSVGGPQRDLESVIAVQLFFATFVLTPIGLYLGGFISF